MQRLTVLTELGQKNRQLSDEAASHCPSYDMA